MQLLLIDTVFPFMPTKWRCPFLKYQFEEVLLCHTAQGASVTG